jgi:hypothetical protein
MDGIKSWKLDSGDFSDIWWKYFCKHCHKQIMVGYHLNKTCPHCNREDWEIILYTEGGKHCILNAEYPYEKIDVGDSIELYGYEV